MDALNSMTIYPDPRYILLNGRHAYPRIITNPVYNDELGVAFLLSMPPSFLCFNTMFDNAINCRYVCLFRCGRWPHSEWQLDSRRLRALYSGNWTLVPTAAETPGWQLDSRPVCL